LPRRCNWQHAVLPFLGGNETERKRRERTKGKGGKWTKNGRRWGRGDGSGNDKVGKRMRRQERKGGGRKGVKL